MELHNLHLYQVWLEYVEQFQSYKAYYTISKLIITMGHISVNIVKELQFLLAAHRLIMVYICIKFCQNMLNGKIYGANTILILFITKGHNSTNIARGVTALVL